MTQSSGPESTSVERPESTSVKRGATEEASGVPLTDTEIETSTRPPSQPAPDRSGDDDETHLISRPDGAGMAGGASGGSGGGSGLSGHPDAAG